MKIAVIGWGSLIWCPGSLGIQSRWHRDGPELPVEFARVSRDGRLTLVLVENQAAQQTYWAASKFSDIENARKDLMRREGTKLCYVESLCVSECNAPEENVKHIIQRWCEEKQWDGALWTALPAEDRDKKKWSSIPDGPFSYLSSISDPCTKERAKEYVENAPPNINTEVRKMARSRLGWEDRTLPDFLFEE